MTMTITVHEKVIADEIWCVKVLSGERGGGWVEDTRMVGQLWDGAMLKVTANSGVGGGVRVGILAGYGVHTIGEIHHM
jgi:hypothetical protein